MSILTLDQVLVRPRGSSKGGRLSASRDGKGLTFCMGSGGGVEGSFSGGMQDDDPLSSASWRSGIIDT